MSDFLGNPPQFPLRPEAAEQGSLHEASRKEASVHRWIESEKARRDLGEAAEREWEQAHWRGFLRARMLEHLGGTRFWIELDPAAFGRLWQTPEELRPLVREVCRMLSAGAGAAELLAWAQDRPARERRAVGWMLADLAGPRQDGPGMVL